MGWVALRVNTRPPSRGSTSAATSSLPRMELQAPPRHSACADAPPEPLAELRFGRPCRPRACILRKWGWGRSWERERNTAALAFPRQSNGPGKMLSVQSRPPPRGPGHARARNTAVGGVPVPVGSRARTTAHAGQPGPEGARRQASSRQCRAAGRVRDVGRGMLESDSNQPRVARARSCQHCLALPPGRYACQSSLVPHPSTQQAVALPKTGRVGFCCFDASSGASRSWLCLRGWRAASDPSAHRRINATIAARLTCKRVVIVR